MSLLKSGTQRAEHDVRFALPGKIAAIGGRNARQAFSVLDVNGAAVDGHRPQPAHGREILAPLHSALEVGSKQHLASFGAAPNEKYAIAGRGTPNGNAVVAAPVGFATGTVPRCAAAVARPATKTQTELRMIQCGPRVLARRHGLARLLDRVVGQSVPFDLMFAFGEKLTVEQLSNDEPFFVREC